MPKNINDIYIIDNRELVFNVTTNVGESETVFFSTSNRTSTSCQDQICTLSDISGFGLKRVKFQSINNGKQILIRESD